MIGTLSRDSKGGITAAPSLYQPSREVSSFTADIRDDYQTGYDIQRRPFQEFGNKTFLSTLEEDRKAWLSIKPGQSADPDEAWHYNGVRPVTRNKLIGIAAQVTATLLYPNIFAQNDKDEEDKMGAETMRDLMEWNVRNSDYENVFLFSTVAALASPVTYMGVGFHEAMQTIREKNESGKITKKEVVDSVLSGLQAFTIPADSILISNAYEYYHQRQRFIIRRRFIDYDEAEALYKNHENFKYVEPGVKAIFDETSGYFYNQHDDDLKSLCEEVTYWNRREDTEVVFVNGVYMGASDVEANPFKHRDNENKPKYPQAKSGYEPIDEMRFYYYFSAARKLDPDQELLNKMWRMTMDGTYMQVMPPLGVVGDVELNSSVMFPGAVTNFGKNASQITPLTNGGNLNAAYNALDRIERSMTESSQDNQMSGIDTAGAKTAYEVATIEQNAKVKLGLFGKMIGSLVKDVGYLMIDDIIQHQTVAEVDEITDEVKYKSFLIPEQVVGGKNVTKKIELTTETPEEPMDVMQKSFELLSKEGGLDADKRIRLVNPEKFRKLKFMLYVSPDQLMPKSDRIERAMKLEVYDRLSQNPLIAGDPEAFRAVTRDFLISPYEKSDPEKYLPKEKQPMQQAQMMGQGGKAPQNPGMVSQMSESNPLASMLRGQKMV